MTGRHTLLENDRLSCNDRQRRVIMHCWKMTVRPALLEIIDHQILQKSTSQREVG